MRTRFITFEGGEGAGKSTQIQLLAEALRTVGEDVITTREPGGTPAAEQVRALLVSGDVDRWSPLTEVLLNYAARAEHVEALIKPALDRGAWVLCDRFSDSTLAYQGHAGGVAVSRIDAIHKAILGDFMPSLTFVFDLPVDVGLARAQQRETEAATAEDRFERKGEGFHGRLREGFLRIAEENPARCHVVDAAQDIATVARDILSKFEQAYGINVV